LGLIINASSFGLFRRIFKEKKRMRNTVILQISAILLFAGAASAVDPNLVAWYTFDEGSGTIAHDSARTHNGTVYGASWTTGKVGGALSFSGFNNYVSAADDPELNITGDITIAAWVNFNVAGDGYDGSEKAIVTKTLWNGAFDNPYDFRTSISTQGSLAMVRANETMHEVTYSEALIPLHSWHHVAVRVENMVTDFYVDGMLTSKSVGGPLLTSPPTGNDLSLLIGARDDGLFFNGMIDDVRLYNRALSATEIRNIPEPASAAIMILGSALIASRRKK
jgi:hypothetical protein